MGKLIHIEDSLNPHLKTITSIPSGMRLIDFLKTLTLVNPRIFLNGKQLAEIDENGKFNLLINIDDNYRLVNNDNIIIINEVRGITGGIIGQILLTTLIGTAVSYGLNLLFAPDKPTIPRTAEQSKAETEYTVDTNQNQAKNGEPIPECFGSYVRYPDIISAPYRRYQNNKQYLYMLLCVGVGQNEINDIYIEDTQIGKFKPGTIQYKTFKTETSHTGNDKIKDSWENSIALESFVPATTIDGHVMDGNDYTISLEPNLNETTEANVKFKIVTPETTEDFIEFVFVQTFIKDSVEIETKRTSKRRFLDNSTTFTEVTSSYDLGEFDEVKLNYEIVGGGGAFTMTLESYDVFEAGVTPDPYFRDVVITAKEIQNTKLTTAEPFNPIQLNSQGTLTDYIEFDILFPNGLFTQNNDGSLGNRTVTIRLSHTDSQNNTIFHDETITDATRNQIRKTYGYSVAPDYYTTVAERLTDDTTDTKIQDTIYIENMKAYLINNNITGNGFIDYGDITLLAIKIKATEGVSAKGQFKVKVKGTRDNILTVKQAMEYIWTTENGGNLDIDDLDLPEINEEYNNIIKKRTTVYKMLQSMASSALYNVYPSFDGKIKAKKDEAQPVRRIVFNEASIIRDSLRVNTTSIRDGDHDGVTGIYKDALTFEEKTYTYPEDASFPQEVPLDGTTDDTLAQARVKFTHLQNIKRRTKYQFDTELQGLVPTMFERVGVSHPVISNSQSGVLLDFTTNTVTLNETVHETYVNPKIFFRGRDGKPSLYYTITQIAGRTLTLDVNINPLPTDLYVGDEEQRTIYTLGEGEEYVDDIIVSEIKPKKDNVVSILGWNYDESIHQ